jgi:hypothetical protein
LSARPCFLIIAWYLAGVSKRQRHRRRPSFRSSKKRGRRFQDSSVAFAGTGIATPS